MRITTSSVLCLFLITGIQAQTPTHQHVINNLVGSASSVVRSIDTDSQGNLVICGTRMDALDFGTTEYAAGASPLFLAKFSPQGTELWSRVAGSTTSIIGQGANAVAVDGDDNIYFTGQLFPSETSTFEGVTLAAGAAGFVAKYNSAGSVLWVKDFPATIQAIAIDASGSPIVTRYENAILKLDPANGNTLVETPASGNLMNPQFHNIVVDGDNNIIAQWGNKITKYNNDLVEIWSTPITFSLAETYRVSVDGEGNVWATFYALFGTVTLGGTDYTTFPNGYIYNLDGTTGEVLGCNVYSASKPKEVIHDVAGNFYVNGDLSFNAAHIVKLDASFAVLWSAPTFDVQEMDLVAEDCLVLGGRHAADITLEGTTYTRPNASGQDNAMAGFLCAGGVGMDESGNAMEFTVFPNPAVDHVTFPGAAKGALTIYSASGQLVRTGRIAGPNTTIPTTDLVEGLYLVRDAVGRSARLVVRR
jgi:hypothetical protein